MTNILVTGGKGQLGQTLQDLASAYGQYNFRFTDKEELDVTSAEDVKRYLKNNPCDCLINCAGYTSVDGAEDDSAAASLLNAKAAGILAEATAKKGALMVHLSTDYVFDGKKSRPYSEGDSANPRSVYGKSKLDGEIEVIFNAKRAIIIRTSWLYSSHGKNFVKTIREKAGEEKEIKVVVDQIGTPTSASDLGMAILHMLPTIPSRMRGEIFNYSNEGVASWYDVAMAVVEMEGLDCKVIPVMTREVSSRAERPHYSVLDKSRIKKEYALQIPHWRNSLRVCLDALKTK